jgi:GNAT superfamily N-acetyltransferase
MDGSLRIEPAAVPDIPALSALLTLLFAQEAEFRPDPAAQQCGLQAILGDPNIGLILVARQGGEIAGMVSLLFTISTALGGRVALLEDMVVSPRHRGAGVGARLLAEAMTQARQQGCLRITLLTDRANEAAQRFYARQGFAASPMLPLRLLL